MFTEYKIGAPPSLLNFSYKLFVEKHVLGIVVLNIPHFDESGVVVGENVPNILITYVYVRSHILKVRMQESKALQEIIGSSITEKDMAKGIIQMMNPKVAGMPSS